MSIAICSATIAVCTAAPCSIGTMIEVTALAPGGFERIRPVRRQCANGRHALTSDRDSHCGQTTEAGHIELRIPR